MVKTEAEVRQSILQYVDKLQKSIKVQKAILFGSYARGGPRDYSDIDVAIISDDLSKLSFVRRQELLGLKTIGCDVFLEPIGFTLKQYQKDGYPFLGEIKRTGKVIYEAD